MILLLLGEVLEHQEVDMFPLLRTDVVSASMLDCSMLGRCPAIRA